MTTTNSIELLQTVRFQSSLDDKQAARGEKQTAIDQQKTAIERTHSLRLDQIAQERDARESRGLGTLIGSIICPVVGTLIGSAIGNACGDDERDAAAHDKTLAGMTNIEREKAEDRFAKASDTYEDASSRNDQLEKFGKELRGDQTELTVI